MKKSIVIFTLIFVAISIFYIYGRPIYKPIYQRIMGKETVDSIRKKYKDKVNENLKNLLSSAGFSEFPNSLLLVAYKNEQELQVFGNLEGKWKLIKTYEFTNFSGVLGPKLKEGDRQIPEGIYEIEYLNPNSAYHLSLKINYPNEFDNKKAKLESRTDLGSDIFIHGDNVTVGCIPVGDEAIEEIFILSSEAIDSGIEVIISPYKFNDSDLPEIENKTPWLNELYQNIKLELESKINIKSVQTL
ncbi:MAG: murein L,D-transpeptidase family protein [Chlorobiota bacterium]